MAFRRRVKNFVKNYSDAEIKVREATSNDPWGPSSSLMLDISDLTFNAISLSEIMNMLWQRLSDHGKNWRHVYKSLTLMDYLIKHGSKKFIQHCREGLFNLQVLKDFQHIDEAGKDQGYYIREKSKQVITLLMNKQLLYKARKVAYRTRRRTSCSLLFPKRLPATGNSPAARASALTPETPASEKERKLLKVSSLRDKEKARMKSKPCQDIALLAEDVSSRETLSPFKVDVWGSTEDLILFCEETPTPPSPTVPPSVISSAPRLSQGEVSLCGADAVPTPSGEKKPFLWTDVSLDKRSENTISNTVLENPLQTPQEKQTTAKSVETLTPLSAFWSSSTEGLISPNLRVSESDITFHNQSFVETLYTCPSFKTVNAGRGTAIKKDLRTAVEASMLERDVGDLKTSTPRVSTASEGINSSSASSALSPDTAPPEWSPHHFPSLPARAAFWTLPCPQPSSATPKHRDNRTPRTHHRLIPEGPVPSNEEETYNFHVLGDLPDNSDSAKNKIHHISSSNWVTFPTQNVDDLPSASCSGFLPTKGLPREPEANSSVKVLLEEVKSAVVRLHEDLSKVIHELSVISSHLGGTNRDNLRASSSLQDPRCSEETADEA